ncbi:MAG TPA: prolipoprotein diacylglyceryl transferase, partial [Eubacteriales bacterium]|nr:prolipoprotein diacylglyceryl transferase [Eubacteriales bacterium]
MEFLLAAINRVAFSIGSLTVEWYGLILTSAMVIGLIYIIREGKRIDLKPDDSLELFLWIIPLAVIFARLLYVLVRPDEYLPVKTWDDFVNFIAIWEGGITIIGGILGGVIGGIIFSLIRKRNFGKVADLIIPALLLGQAIGRWGNFINQEAFGVAISNPALQWFPFAVYIDSPFAGVAEGWYAAT